MCFDTTYHRLKEKTEKKKKKTITYGGVCLLLYHRIRLVQATSRGNEFVTISYP